MCQVPMKSSSPGSLALCARRRSMQWWGSSVRMARRASPGPSPSSASLKLYTTSSPWPRPAQSSLVDLELVPEAKSSCSTQATFKPRSCASKATPAPQTSESRPWRPWPVAPPPTTSTSNSSPEAKRLSCCCRVGMGFSSTVLAKST